MNYNEIRVIVASFDRTTEVLLREIDSLSFDVYTPTNVSVRVARLAGYDYKVTDCNCSDEELLKAVRKSREWRITKSRPMQGKAVSQTWERCGRTDSEYEAYLRANGATPMREIGGAR